MFARDRDLEQFIPLFTLHSLERQGSRQPWNNLLTASASQQTSTRMRSCRLFVLIFDGLRGFGRRWRRFLLLLFQPGANLLEAQVIPHAPVLADFCARSLPAAAAARLAIVR